MNCKFRGKILKINDTITFKISDIVQKEENVQRSISLYGFNIISPLSYDKWTITEFITDIPHCKGINIHNKVIENSIIVIPVPNSSDINETKRVFWYVDLTNEKICQFEDGHAMYNLDDLSIHNETLCLYNSLEIKYNLLITFDIIDSFNNHRSNKLARSISNYGNVEISPFDYDEWVVVSKIHEIPNFKGGYQRSGKLNVDCILIEPKNYDTTDTVFNEDIFWFLDLCNNNICQYEDGYPIARFDNLKIIE